MKIALLTDGITPFVIGGMQKHSYNLAKYLTIHGVHITVFHYENNNKIISNKQLKNVLFGRKSDYKVESQCLTFPSSIKFPGHYIYNSYRYSKLIAAKLAPIINEFDFIYAKGFCAWKLLQLKKKGNQFPKIGVNFHGFEMWQKPPNRKIFCQYLFLRPFVKWNIENSDYVFSYGSKISSIIKELGINNKVIIESPSGIDDDFITKEDLKINKKRKFVFVGRYERRKGIEELSSVIKLLNFKKHDVEFHFVGEIPVEKRLDINNVFYHGLVGETKKVINILDEMDILICPSYSEGMPNVILESMARGLAIIATDVGANSLLVDNKVGWLIDANNIENQLLEYIKKSLHINDSQLLIMKKESISRINQKFNWNFIVDDLIKKISK